MKVHSAKTLSLFSGIGGLDLGLRRAGFTILGHVERDPLARRSLSANFPESRFFEPHDVVQFAEILGSLDLSSKDVDVIAGGPPCQPFSTAAQYRRSGRSGMDDPRAKAVDALFAIIRHFRPKVVILENVAGFLSRRIGAIAEFENFVEEESKNGGPQYSLHTKVIDSADVGVPQHRKRGIIVLADETDWRWPVSTHAESPMTAWDALADIRPHQPPAPSGKWGELLRSVPEGENYIWFTKRGGGPALFGYRTRFWSFLLKLAKNRPSWTIPASPGPSTGPFHWTGRPLAIEEALALQSFPVEYKVKGTRRQQFRQVGNATPPLLAEVLGRAVGQQFFSMEYTEEPTLLGTRAEGVPDPVPPKPLADKYKELIGEHDPHPGPGLGPSPVMSEASSG